MWAVDGGGARRRKGRYNKEERRRIKASVRLPPYAVEFLSLYLRGPLPLAGRS